MTQRRPRLGDILDDYCPRERRITNHAVVAMVEDDVKQTRCTTCDTEHEFKHAKVPTSRKRKSETPPAHLVEAGSRPPVDVEETHEDVPEADLPVMADEAVESESEEPVELAAAPDAAAEPVSEPEPAEDEGANESDNWPVHRPLIRAQLPRPEGHVPERKPTDFTIRPGGKFDANRNGQRHRGGHRPTRHAQGGQPSGQGSRFGGQRGPGGPGGGGPFGQRQGNRPGQGGGRPGQGQGQGQGPGRGPRPGGGRKRGR